MRPTLASLSYRFIALDVWESRIALKTSVKVLLPVETVSIFISVDVLAINASTSQFSPALIYTKHPQVYA
jgi:hypothetical protein